MTRTNEDLEMIRLKMEFGVWLRQRSNVRLSSGLGQYMFERWIKGQCVQLNTKEPWVSVTIHV